jgi:Kef-type K+ transport system membrane component KefB
MIGADAAVAVDVFRGAFLLAADFPPESAEWTFFISFFVLLAAPILAGLLRLPGIVGLLLGGVLVGPFVLGWVERTGTVESIGQLGLLMLMFLAGLELDLDEFARHRGSVARYGLLSFSIPFGLGIALVLAFGYGFAAAALYGSLWASHTLVSFPIVQERGLATNRAVGMAAGGTVITDTFSLTVLAVVAGYATSDAGPTGLVLKIVVGLAGLIAYCAVVLPWLTRIAFAKLGRQWIPRVLVLLVGLTSAALVADLAGIEGLVGAFFAGLTLNRLVPARGVLMEGVEFLGGVLLVPFFLFSTGMLVDPAKFTDPRLLLIAGLSLAVVFIGKGAAAWIAGRLTRLSGAEVELMFGLSIAQAAATLAAVTVGVNVGVFDEDLLNASLIVVLVTVLVAGVATRVAADRVEPPEERRDRIADTILVPVTRGLTAETVDVAARLAMAKGGRVLTMAIAGPRDDEGLARSKENAARAAAAGSAVGAEADPVVRVNDSVLAGLVSVADEQRATLVLMDWQQALVIRDLVDQGRKVPAIGLDTPVLVVSPGERPFTRAVLALSADDLAAPETLDIAVAVMQAVAAAGAKTAVLAADADTASAIAERIGGTVETIVDHGDRADVLAGSLSTEDLALLPGGGAAELLPSDGLDLLARTFAGSVAVSYPSGGRARSATGTIVVRPRES